MCCPNLSEKIGNGKWGTRGPLWGLGAMGNGKTILRSLYMINYQLPDLLFISIETVKEVIISKGLIIKDMINNSPLDQDLP